MVLVVRTCLPMQKTQIPGSGRSPRGGHGKPLQYSCLENPHRWRSLVGYSLWDCKELGMREATYHKHTMCQALSKMQILEIF